MPSRTIQRRQVERTGKNINKYKYTTQNSVVNHVVPTKGEIDPSKLKKNLAFKVFKVLLYVGTQVGRFFLIIEGRILALSVGKARCTASPTEPFPN